MNEPSAPYNSETNLSNLKDTQLVKAEDAKSDKAKDTQLIIAKDSKSDKSKDKAENTDRASQILSTVNSGLKAAGNISTAVSKVITQREKTKMEELKIRGNIIVNIQTMVGQFANQIDKMKDSQNATITKIAAEFTTIVQEAAKRCDPDKTETAIGNRLNLHPNYTRKKKSLDRLVSQLEKLEDENSDTPEIKEKIKALKTEIKDLDRETLDIYEKTTADIKALFLTYKEKMDKSEKAFGELITGLVQEGSKDIREVISLQKQIVQLFNNYMELSFNVRPSTQSTVTIEELSDNKDKVSIKALLGGAGSYKPAAIANSPNSAANANSVADVNLAAKP